MSFPLAWSYFSVFFLALPITYCSGTSINSINTIRKTDAGLIISHSKNNEVNINAENEWSKCKMFMHTVYSLKFMPGYESCYSVKSDN